MHLRRALGTNSAKSVSTRQPRLRPPLPAREEFPKSKTRPHSTEFAQIFAKRFLSIDAHSSKCPRARFRVCETATRHRKATTRANAFRRRKRFLDVAIPSSKRFRSNPAHDKTRHLLRNSRNPFPRHREKSTTRARRDTHAFLRREDFRARRKMRRLHERVAVFLAQKKEAFPRENCGDASSCFWLGNVISLSRKARTRRFPSGNYA